MEQVIVGGYSGGLHATGNRNNHLNGGDTWITDASILYRRRLVTTPGTFKDLRVDLDTAPGVGKSWAITIWVNGDSTAGDLSCTIADAAVQGKSTGSATAAAGDWVAIHFNPAGTPTLPTSVRWSIIFEADNPKESLLLGGYPNDINTTNTEYNQCHGGRAWTTVLRDIWEPVPTSGKIKNLYVELEDAPGAGASGKQFDFTLMLNGNPTALTVNILEIATKGNNIVNEIAVSPGDYIYIECDPTNDPIVGWAWWGFTFVADTDGESLIMGGNYDNWSTAATEYNAMQSSHQGGPWDADETLRHQGAMPPECILKKMYIKLSVAPGAGNDQILTLRKSTAGVMGDTLLSVTLSGAAETEKGDAVNTVTFTEYDRIDLEATPVSTPASTDAGWSCVAYIPVPSVGVDSTLHLKLGLGGYGDQGGRLRGPGHSTMASRPYRRLH